MEKTEGELMFDQGTGTFWIAVNGAGREQIQFGDTFEVKDENDNWVESGLEITTDLWGNLAFKLKNTNYSGHIEGIEARK